MTVSWEIIKVLVFLAGVFVWSVVLIGIIAGSGYRVGLAIGHRLLRRGGGIGERDDADLSAAMSSRPPRDDDDVAWLEQMGQGLKRPAGQASSSHARIFTSAPAGGRDAADGVYGPNTAVVLRFLEDLRRPETWTPERIKACALRPAHAAARRAALREAELSQPPREYQRAAAWTKVRGTGTGRSWAAAWAASALVVRDLIDEQHFTALTKPFADLIDAYDTTETPDA